jgi:hypothetical protein
LNKLWELFKNIFETFGIFLNNSIRFRKILPNTLINIDIAMINPPIQNNPALQMLKLMLNNSCSKPLNPNNFLFKILGIVMNQQLIISWNNKLYEGKGYALLMVFYDILRVDDAWVD